MPSTPVALIILVAALAPGWAYLQSYRRKAPRDPRSPAAEVVEMGAVGALSTSAAALAVLAAASVVPHLITMSTLFRGTAALREKPGATILTAALILLSLFHLDRAGHGLVAVGGSGR